MSEPPLDAPLSNSSLSFPWSTQTQDDAHWLASMPKAVGNYHLKRLIATGGMGSVFEAVQENPRRAVAVKMMRRGITSSSALRRFQYESQLLARLRHPGIAQIYEADVHDDGSGPVPFFAMEYIPNARRITQYAREKKLNLRRRLELFLQVCDAVHYGHQRGVIHRDLKPANLLVDSDGRIKVIDYGVARATDADLAITTLQTNVGQLLGTLQYMSPEQCEGDPHDLDSRSDVYALGVVLYELLCDRPPYDLADITVPMAIRVIRDYPPLRPSVVQPTIRGDVETILLKAMEKDRERRYRTAGELSDDIRRYLNNEPVAARPPSLVYQIRKLAKRHRVGVLACLLVFLSLTGGLIASTTLYWRASAAQSQAEAVTRFLTDTLSSTNPYEEGGREVTLVDVLNQAAGKLDEAFPEQPLVEASVRRIIGHIFTVLGRFPAAKPQLERALSVRRLALPAGHPQIAESLTDLSELLQAEGDFQKALPLCREALKIRRRVLGDDHPDVALAMNDFAQLLHNNADFTAAAQMYKEAINLRIEGVGTVDCEVTEFKNNLAVLYRQMGDLDRAEALSLEVLAQQRELFDRDHVDIAITLNNLATVYSEKGRLDEADAEFSKVESMFRKLLGETHGSVATPLEGRAGVLMKRDQFVEAEALFREALGIRMSEMPRHWRTASALIMLGKCLVAQNRFGEAEPLMLEGYAKLAVLRGPSDMYTLQAAERTVELYQQWGKAAHALEWRAKAEARTPQIPDDKSVTQK